VLVPGAFGERGAEGKIASITFAREREIPFFGICFGMQLACIEAARNLAGLEGASSTEFSDEAGGGAPAHPIVGMMTEWMRGNELETRRSSGDLGGTMRLGAYAANLEPRSKVAQIYGAEVISERHRHRYEVNTRYRGALEEAGLVFCGMSPDGLLPEVIERPEHPWFVGVQFHPELRSRPFEPHPLFADFVRAAVVQSRLV
jgi:CTP synthase